VESVELPESRRPSQVLSFLCGCLTENVCCGLSFLPFKEAVKRDGDGRGSTMIMMMVTIMILTHID
jgi:hypothetical protein